MHRNLGRKLLFPALALALAGLIAAAHGKAAGGVFYASGDPARKEFALTYDDGPGQITPELLALLERKGAKATFFVLGSSARAKPDLVKRVAAAGHEVASHTDSHLLWKKVARGADRASVLKKELSKAAAAIEKAGGGRPAVLRMPNGYDAPWVREVAKAEGYTLVNWTYGSDWVRQADGKLLAEYLKALKPGAILLMHDGGGKNRERNLKVTEALLDEAARRGLRPRRVDELLGLAPFK